MARGVLSGVIWGGVVSVVGLGAVSVAVDPPAMPDRTEVAGGGSGDAPARVPPTEADPTPDPEIARETPPGNAPAPAVTPEASAPDQPRQPGVEDSGLTRAPEPSDNPDAPPMAEGPQGDSAPVIGEAGAPAPAPAPAVDAPDQPGGGDAIESAGVTMPGTDGAPEEPETLARSNEPAAEPGPEVATDPAAVPPAPEVSTETAAAPAQPVPGDSGIAAAGGSDAPVEMAEAPAAPETPSESGLPQIDESPAPEPEPEPEPDPDQVAEAAPAEPAPADEAPEQGEGGLPDMSLVQSNEDEAPRVGQGASDLSRLAPNVRTGRLPSLGGGAETSADEAEPAPSPLERYAVPVEVPEGAPRLAIVLIDDGRGGFGSEALAAFPYPLTFAVNAAAPNAAERAADYRSRGFEVLALGGVPEGAAPQDAEVALEALLGAVPEAIGLMETPDSGLQRDRAVATQVASVLAQTGHGLVLFPKGLNTGAALAEREGVPVASVFRDLDGDGQSPGAIRRQLDQAALRAGQEGSVLLAARLRPDTISALLLWGLQDRSGQLALVPASGVLTGN